MKTKKVFIISYNNLTTDFWKQHLELDKTTFWHWNNPKLGEDNFTTVWPDIVIVDGYWAKEPFTPCLVKLLKIKSNTKFFCITNQSDHKIKSIHSNLYISRLDNDLLNEINIHINQRPNATINQLKKSA